MDSVVGVNESVANCKCTILFAQDKQQLSSTVLHICVNVSHQANQLVSKGGVLLRPGGNIPQRG